MFLFKCFCIICSLRFAQKLRYLAAERCKHTCLFSLFPSKRFLVVALFSSCAILTFDDAKLVNVSLYTYK